MPKVSVRTPEQLKPGPLPSGLSGDMGARAYFDAAGQPLHLHAVEIGRDDCLCIDAGALDRLAYLWRGAVASGGHPLAQGSSLIVERGARLDVTGTADTALLLVFSAAQPPVQPRGGGKVHLLPVETVPRADSLGGASGLGGAMHANGECPGCGLWLHENWFAGRPDAARDDAEAGIHSHSEDEIIFVTAGEIRLGARLFGPGTALAIAADTLYSFTPGPDGLAFINFRAAIPGDIRLRSGHTINEPDYWRQRLPPPRYLAPYS